MSVRQELEKIDGRTWRGKQLYYKKDASGTKRQAIIKKCQQCEEEFASRKHEEKRNKRKYCSLSCSGKASRQKIDQTGENNPAWKGKRQYVEDIKDKSECEDCGEERNACLCFHHENPEEKTASVTRMASGDYGLQTIKEEVEKCVILCHNCHALRHKEG